MKTISLTFFVITLLAARADQTTLSQSIEGVTMRRVEETPPTLDETKPNEIKVGKLSYSGIAVQAVKVDIALELLNPAAPLRYGLAEDNVIREPSGGKISGLKIFSIAF